MSGMRTSVYLPDALAAKLEQSGRTVRDLVEQALTTQEAPSTQPDAPAAPSMPEPLARQLLDALTEIRTTVGLIWQTMNGDTDPEDFDRAAYTAHLEADLRDEAARDQMKLRANIKHDPNKPFEVTTTQAMQVFGFSAATSKGKMCRLVMAGLATENDHRPRNERVWTVDPAALDHLHERGESNPM